MTELVKITLAKEWNKHAEGATVTVDSDRAAWLQDNGFLEKKKKRERVSKPKED